MVSIGSGVRQGVPGTSGRLLMHSSHGGESRRSLGTIGEGAQWRSVTARIGLYVESDISMYFQEIL
jgi:hypothetical protein